MCSRHSTSHVRYVRQMCLCVFACLPIGIVGMYADAQGRRKYIYEHRHISSNNNCQSVWSSLSVTLEQIIKTESTSKCIVCAWMVENFFQFSELETCKELISKRYSTSLTSTTQTRLTYSWKGVERNGDFSHPFRIRSTANGNAITVIQTHTKWSLLWPFDVPHVSLACIKHRTSEHQRSVSVGLLPVITVFDKFTAPRPIFFPIRRRRAFLCLFAA